jgi:hypothetical protein
LKEFETLDGVDGDKQGEFLRSRGFLVVAIIASPSTFDCFPTTARVIRVDPLLPAEVQNGSFICDKHEEAAFILQDCLSVRGEGSIVSWTRARWFAFPVDLGIQTSQD